MVDDSDPDSHALTNGDITRFRALVARISYLSQDRPDLKFASMQVRCAMAKPTTRDMERVKRIGRYLGGKPRARCWFLWQQSGELEAYSDADWGGDKATRRSVSAGVIMRGAHCLKVWTKKQQVVALSSTESELYAAPHFFHPIFLLLVKLFLVHFSIRTLQRSEWACAFVFSLIALQPGHPTVAPNSSMSCLV